MAVKSSLVTVGTAATVLADHTSLASAGVGATGFARVIVSVPASGQTVYLGGPDVTAAGATQGLPVATGTVAPPIELAFGDILYGIVAATTQPTNVLRALAGNEDDQ